MKMQDRLAAMIENGYEEIERINGKIDEAMREAEKWRTRRLDLEEEIVEARVTLNFLQLHQVNVERNAEGVLVASMDPVEPT